ncbi:unnamed protein product [Brassica oleracea]|uniref:(rape) hypothetical protein n=1 Tax=Brassica napus TaxID=3708 RepID=A0A816KIW6_BRANA|nr:unnamed protein product [Brassica napus]
MLDVDTKSSSRLEQLELIDDLENLRVSYHFEVEINNILNDFYHKIVWKCEYEEGLHATTLGFQLLRQHGFNVSEEKFVDGGETCNAEVRENEIHALEMPYHWRMRRLEARWYIDAYKKKHDKNIDLFEFPKIDFNFLQSYHQEELKHVSRYFYRLVEE